LNKEVEIIKIGQIVRQPDSRFIIMTVEEDDSTISHYLSILRDYASGYLPNYSLLKTQGIIRPSAEDKYGSLPPWSSEKKHLRGISDGDPIIGQSFTINNSSWHTSRIENIINDNILLTKNSVYAIHTLSTMRDQKLKNLGID
jgi:hypothetical protein